MRRIIMEEEGRAGAYVILALGIAIALIIWAAH